MADWDGDDRLNETDLAILGRLEQGRETTGSLADHLGKHPQTVRDRLRWLRGLDYVRYYHENTGLHELEHDGGQDVEEGDAVEDGGQNGTVSESSGEWHQDADELLDEEAPE